MKMNEIKTYREFTSGTSVKQKLRSVARNSMISALSLKKDISKIDNCIQFPYYHHVFDDEVKGFERQLLYLKNYGDFITLDDVCELVTGDRPLKGRYFCVSFDDGFKNTYANMLEITSRLEIPTMIYLPTNYIGLKTEIPEALEKIKSFHPKDPKITTFLTWDECREMISKNVQFGSHTVDHVNLSTITPKQIEFELAKSKEIIENELQVRCNHFACPWGRIGVDFDPEITTAIAKKLGYNSVVTTNRGTTGKGDDLFTLKRDHLLANWSTAQLNYFFGI